MEKKAVHINEAMQILDLARERRQTVNLKVWEGQTGNILDYRGWLVSSSSWRKGWLCRNSSSAKKGAARSKAA